MKKQKNSLQLRKQQISSLSQEQVTGGFFTYTGNDPTLQPESFIIMQCITINCEPLPTYGVNCMTGINSATCTFSCWC